MPEVVNAHRELLHPTAWAIGVVSAISAAALVMLGVVGAVVTFAGGDLMMFQSASSYVFMSVLIAVAVLAGVSMLLVAGQCAREARRGYTTIANAYPRLEWRDHKTGLVFREAGAATPRLSTAELRSRASSVHNER
ncbi:hypothetical protein [Leifsonia sp. Leaf336]|uniref:hypothetical protein n=1 Tax=Leifsonia sp. Leaf336 TaxID=1736341 RepID=UPI0012F7F3C2|nr:hypothetical protein [Leifsonia sp. Leaf336]